MRRAQQAKPAGGHQATQLNACRAGAVGDGRTAPRATFRVFHDVLTPEHVGPGTW